MAKKETLSTGPGGAPVNPGKSDWAGNSSRATPEEGVVDSCFHGYKATRSVLREAIITFVAALSEPYENGL